MKMMSSMGSDNEVVEMIHQMHFKWTTLSFIVNVISKSNLAGGDFY